MSWRRAFVVVGPALAVLLAIGLGFAALTGDRSAPGDEDIVRAQAAGGLGVVVPPTPSTAPPATPQVQSQIATPPPTQEQQARQILASQRGMGQAPLVQGMSQDPQLLMNVMQMVRNDPALRSQALGRVRQSGVGGQAAAGMTDEMLTGALDSLLQDPARLEAVLGQIGSSPNLLQGMLGQMGLPDVSQEEINFVLQQAGNNPQLLSGLASGDQATIDGMADDLATHMNGGQPELSSLLASMGGQPTGGYVVPGQYGMPGQYGGNPGAMQVSPMMGSELLGAGASLSLLADMIGSFGGGNTSHLQGALRAGDLSAIYGMVDSLYGPNGSLSYNPDLGGGQVNSYTDLLDALMDME